MREGLAAALERAVEELTAEGRPGELPSPTAVADSVESAMFNLYGKPDVYLRISLVSEHKLGTRFYQSNTNA